MIPLILFAAAASGFETTVTETGEAVKWRDFPVPFAVDLRDAPDVLSEDEWLDAIEASFDMWASVDETKVQFREAELVSGAGSISDGENTLWFETEWTDDPDVGAVASVWVDNTTIVGFDIRINAETVAWSVDGSETDAQAAVTHEVGHALGIAHSQFEVATMYYELTGDDVVRRNLDGDDERAVSHLYSNRVLGVPKFLSCNTASQAGWSPWGLVAFLVVARRKNQLGNS